MSNKVEHLNMIQSVISRMANNSLQAKCWCLAIVGAAIVLSRSTIIIACVLPVVLFCYLDVRYLSLERSYRNLYDEVRVKSEDEIDFSLETKKVSEWKTFRSWSVWLFYVSMVLLMIGTALYNLYW